MSLSDEDTLLERVQFGGGSIMVLSQQAFPPGKVSIMNFEIVQSNDK